MLYAFIYMSRKQIYSYEMQLISGHLDRDRTQEAMNMGAMSCCWHQFASQEICSGQHYNRDSNCPWYREQLSVKCSALKGHIYNPSKAPRTSSKGVWEESKDEESVWKAVSWARPGHSTLQFSGARITHHGGKGETFSSVVQSLASCSCSCK